MGLSHHRSVCKRWRQIQILLKTRKELIIEITKCDLQLHRYLQLVEEADGLTKIENLQSDSSDEIYLKVRQLLILNGFHGCSTGCTYS